ncbi:MAG TPA: TraM recognition domain-containing protein, partial [Candidatus Saccharimonadales bacterium]|nr:TraM recognition domain-containing protein [Candidatus Saccharimonadales bacterium]
FVDIPKLFRDPQYVKQKLQYVKDLNVREFWQKEMPQSQRSNDFGEVVSWFVSKFGAFLSNEMMRNIIGQTKSAFDLRDIMDNKKILLVNLSKGRTGELNSKLLGMIFVMKFQAAAMSRANIPESERKDFSLYVDEFQNFSTDSFATILSEARKYRLNLIVANQFTTQLTEEVRDAVFGNIGTIVAFRVGQDEDAEALAKRMRPAFETTDLLRMPNYNAVVRTLIGGVPTNPFSMATLPPLGNENPQLAIALKQLSAAKHGRPKAEVEKEIFGRLETLPVPAAEPKPFGAAPGYPQPPSAAGAPFPPAGGNKGGVPKPAAGAAGGGSFLDEWLNKRNGPLAMRPSPWSAPKQPATAPTPASPQAAVSSMPPAAPMSQSQALATSQPVHPLAPSYTPIQPANRPLHPQSAANVPIAPPMAPRQSATTSTPMHHGAAPGDDTIYIDNDGNIHSR